MRTIKTKKLILRPFRLSDAPSVAKYANDKEVAKNTLVLPYPYTLKDANDWLGPTVESYRKKDAKKLVFAIEIDGEACGTVGLHHIEPGHKAELGYWLGRPHRGRGIMTEAVRLVADFGFKDLKLKRIHAYIFSFNLASKRVLEKAGFDQEGYLKKQAKKGNKYIDCFLMAKIKK